MYWVRENVDSTAMFVSLAAFQNQISMSTTGNRKQILTQGVNQPRYFTCWTSLSNGVAETHGATACTKKKSRASSLRWKPRFFQVNGKRPEVPTWYLSPGIVRGDVETGRDPMFDPQPLGQTAARSGFRRKGPIEALESAGPPLPSPSPSRPSSSKRRKSLECRRFLAPQCFLCSSVFFLRRRRIRFRGPGDHGENGNEDHSRQPFRNNTVFRWVLGVLRIGVEVASWYWEGAPASKSFSRWVVEEELNSVNATVYIHRYRLANLYYSVLLF